jgi:hypothetical protein
MSYTILNFETDLARKLHGTTINKVGDIYDIAYEAARNVLAKLDLQESKRASSLSNPIFDDVTRYALPSDLKGDKFISVLPQTNVNPTDNLVHVYGRNFDLNKLYKNGIIDIAYENGTKFLNIAVEGNPGTTLHTVNSVTENGTWAVSANASNLETDSLNYYSGSASLRFDLNSNGGATTGVITNSTIEDVDCSDAEDIGSLFMPLYLTSTTGITSIKLEWGDDGSNNWYKTVTTQSDGTALKAGWNLLQFDWVSSTEVGTPDSSAVAFLRITVNYDGTAQTNLRFDNIVVRVGTLYTIKYYSKFLFRTSAGTWIEKPTASSDIINLDTDSYNLFLYEAAYMLAQEVQGEDAVFDRNFFESRLLELYKEYRANYRSEAYRPQSNYNSQLYQSRRR